MTDDERAKRIHDLTYSCESRTEMCERVVDMEAELERMCEQARKVHDECERLRVLAKYTLLCSEGDVRCEGCPLRDVSAKRSHVVCGARHVARKLGVELYG